jgi:methionyl-tRNA formyltransferase
MRVFIITQDEPVYTPVYLANTIQKSRHSVVGITALPPSGQIGWVNLAKQRLEVYGPLDFIKAVSLYGFSKLMSYWPIRKSSNRFYSVAQVAAYYSIPLYPSSNINAKEYIYSLRELDIDIVLSVAANQRFKRELLDVPRLACLNVHSALLPKYRGLDGIFWALVHGETQVGVTVHLMNEDFDDGAIVGQQPFDVSPNDTLHSLYFKAIEMGSTLLSQALDQFDSGTVLTKTNDIAEGDYFSWPDREAARRFRAHGRRFF